MAIQVIQLLCPASKKPIKFPYSMEPEFIVVHNTANDASARNENAYMCRNNKEVSFHYVIDDKEVIQCLPTNVNAWHAGDGGEGKGNRKGIAIEICYSKSGGEKFIAAEKLAAKFIAQELKARKWGVDRVTKHQDYNGKYCPHRTLDMGWDRFIKMIEAEMNPVVTQAATSTIKANDLVKLSSNATYYSGKAIPAWVKNLNWYVSEVKGDRAVIDKSADGKHKITSPVNVKYLTVVKASAVNKPATAKPTTTTTALAAGTKIHLENVALYASATYPKSAGTRTGDFYIWSPEVVNNRIRITNNKAHVGQTGKVTGFINIEVAKKLVVTEQQVSLTKPKNVKIEAWQKAAIADGFKFPSGADGIWGAECEAVAKQAVCKKQLVYRNKNLTKFLQGHLGISADGKFGNGTKTAVINYQNKNGLTADGIVGLNTWKKILGV